MPLSNYSLEGTLTIDGILLNRPAFAIFGDKTGKGGLIPLWIEFDVRGEDRLLPSATGVIAYPRRMTKTRKDLTLWVVGDIDQAGTPVSNAVSGLEANLEYIRANVLAPVISTTGTRAATLTLPSGASRTANIHVLGLVVQSYQLSRVIDGCAYGAVAETTLQISIPGGRFT